MKITTKLKSNNAVYLKRYMFLLLTDLSQVSSSSLLNLSNNLLIWKVHGMGNFKILLTVFELNNISARSSKL